LKDSLGEDTRVLAVPCSYVWFPFSHVPSGVPSTWAPDVDGTQGFDWDLETNRSLVQFWEIDDPTNIVFDEFVTQENDPGPADDVLSEGHTSLPMILGPSGEEGNAWKLEILEVGTDVYCFVVDFGGKLLVYKVTDLLTTPVTTMPPLWAQFDAPSNYMNSLNPNVWDVEIDETTIDTGGGGGVESRIYVYVAVAHMGIEVLEFRPGESLIEDRFEKVVTIQTAGNPTSLSIREYPSGLKDLLVGDYFAGYRVLGYNRNEQ